MKDEVNMKLIDAVYEVLKDSAAPMGAMEIERAILDRRLYETKGKTLYASIAAAIYIDIKKQGAASRFAKCGKGMFALAGRAAAKVKRTYNKTPLNTASCFRRQFKS